MTNPRGPIIQHDDHPMIMLKNQLESAEKAITYLESENDQLRRDLEWADRVVASFYHEGD